MNRRIFLSQIGGLSALAFSTPAVPKKLDLFLLIGQSNMAGRGKIDATNNSPQKDIWTINSSDQFVRAQHPLHFDKPGVGVGPGMSFAQTVLNHYPKRPIGLIPCAVGGSGIDDWKVGAKHVQTGIHCYDAMLHRVRIAKEFGNLKGILWHQGENDSNAALSPYYAEKITRFFHQLRTDLRAEKVPIIVGTLGDFFVKNNPQANSINTIITNLPNVMERLAVAQADGLEHGGDEIHFSANAANEFGKRYAEKWLTLNK